MKNYLVYIESIYDFEVAEPSYRLFSNEKEAREYFLEQQEVIEDEGIENAWDTELSDNSFSVYEEGRYPENHITLRLVELEVE